MSAGPRPSAPSGSPDVALRALCDYVRDLARKQGWLAYPQQLVDAEQLLEDLGHAPAAPSPDEQAFLDQIHSWLISYGESAPRDRRHRDIAVSRPHWRGDFLYVAPRAFAKHLHDLHGDQAPDPDAIRRALVALGFAKDHVTYTAGRRGDGSRIRSSKGYYRGRVTALQKAQE